MTFLERKAERVAHFNRWVYGWKQRKCIACNGSGYYDGNGGRNGYPPKCGGCDGTGRERYRSIVTEETSR